jgi:hypothetical protein
MGLLYLYPYLLL